MLQCLLNDGGDLSQNQVHYGVRLLNQFTVMMEVSMDIKMVSLNQVRVIKFLG